MLTQEQNRDRVGRDKAAWVSIHTRTLEPLIGEEPSAFVEDQRGNNSVVSPVRLFEQTQQVPLLLPERFPRLTFFAIAVGLLVSAVMTEIDYLRGAGYHW